MLCLMALKKNMLICQWSYSNIVESVYSSVWDCTPHTVYTYIVYLLMKRDPFNVYVFLRSNPVRSHNPFCLGKCTAVFHNQNKCGTLAHLTLASTLKCCELLNTVIEMFQSCAMISSIYEHAMCCVYSDHIVEDSRATQHCTTRWGSSMKVCVGYW